MFTTFFPLDWALFASALISSTLFPGGSEALLLYRLDEGLSNPYMLIFIATLGNVLGSLITYTMGRLGVQLSHKWFKMPQKKITYAETYFKRFGKPALLLAWLPIIGDPLCLVAGILRFNILWFLILISIGKFARYSLLVLPFV